MNWKAEYKDCLEYIDSYWDKIIHSPEKKEVNSHTIDIPHAYITPNDKKFNLIYYWDSFFMFRGLMCTPREWVMRDMVNNFCFLIQTYGFIPNFNSLASGRSQPPFFSSMIFDVYNNLILQKGFKATFQKTISYLYKPMSLNSWLATMISVAQQEYRHVWLDEDGLHHHRVAGYLLSRYGDLDIGYAHSSELESGWDMTSRFYNRCNEFLPIDLNTYLYKYEHDFERAANILGNKTQARHWREKKEKRKGEITRLMWNETEGFFFDYCYTTKRQSEFFSLAGFTPLWAGLATPYQAQQMVKKLPKFLSAYGLFICDKNSLAPTINLSEIPIRYRIAVENILKPKQWDWPHIWPPLEYITVIGLLRYGFVEEAKSVMTQSVHAHATLFRKYGTFFEKIDGALLDKSKDFHYPNQSGFGWTNAVFYRYIHILDDLENKKPIYKPQRSSTPPYQFSMPH